MSETTETNTYLIKCFQCGGIVSKEATTCPHCGGSPTKEAYDKKKKQKNSNLILIIVLLICSAAFCFAMIYFL